jgi:hypothetical protein
VITRWYKARLTEVRDSLNRDRTPQWKADDASFLTGIEREALLVEILSDILHELQEDDE